MDADDYQVQIRQAKTARLRALELKAATFGRNLPAEDLVEIASLRKEVSVVELAISSPISPAFADELGAAGQFQVVTQKLDGMSKRWDDAVAYLGERITAVEVNSEEWRHTERAARATGQASTRTIFLIAGGILFLVVLSLIWLAIVVASRFAGAIT